MAWRGAERVSWAMGGGGGEAPGGGTGPLRPSGARHPEPYAAGQYGNSARLFFLLKPSYEKMEEFSSLVCCLFKHLIS